MEKLLELLNEYDVGVVSREKREYSEITWDMIRWISDDQERLSMADICSKKFWFIERLVENEKIEYRKIIEKEIEVWFKLVRIKDYPNKIMEEDVEELLMLLAIQDEPVRFLCSILR